MQAINQADSSANEANLMKLIHEEMAQFYDVVNNREFEQVCNTKKNQFLNLKNSFFNFQA